MDFLKELLVLNNKSYINELANIYTNDKEEKLYFIKRYTKNNYCTFKIIYSTKCVTIKNTKSKTNSVHNP